MRIAKRSDVESVIIVSCESIMQFKEGIRVSKIIIRVIKIMKYVYPRDIRKTFRNFGSSESR